jgi:hypothetical protein
MKICGINIIGVSLIFLLLAGCTKDTPLPANPYDKKDGDSTKDTTKVIVDPNTITGIHQNIFGPTCANSGCHDGTFEPDFRTIESSYNSLVLQPVTKPDNQNAALLRVTPEDAAASMLYLRLTTNLNDFEARMPLEVDPDSDWPNKQAEYIENIKTWINEGALDQLGNAPTIPNNEPQLNGIVAFADGSSNRLSRNGSNSPMNFPSSGFNLEIWFSLSDDTSPTNSLEIEKVLFSNKLNDFTEATELSATYDGSSISHPGIKGENVNYNFKTTIQPGSIGTKGETIFMRIFVKDENHSTAKEIPGKGSENFIKTYAAFTLQ